MKLFVRSVGSCVCVYLLFIYSGFEEPVLPCRGYEGALLVPENLVVSGHKLLYRKMRMYRYWYLT